MVPAGRHVVLLHRLEQRGLGLGRRAVDLVGQHDVGEDRPRHEPEGALAGGQVLLDDLGAGDVPGHEVGRELHPVEAQLQRLGHGLDHQRLGEARHADEQGVAAGEDGGEDAVDDRVLTDDALGDLGPERCDGRDQALEALEIGGGRGLGGGHRCSTVEGRGSYAGRPPKVASASRLRLFSQAAKSSGYAATGRDEEDRQAYRYASLGMQFAGGTLLFAGLGFLLDRWLHILPALRWRACWWVAD